MKVEGAKKVHYDSGPNMTPLVDVVMVILIFLMLAGSFAGSTRFLMSKQGIHKTGSGGAAKLDDGPEDIELGWLAGASSVGITAGASAPRAVVEQIAAALSGLGAIETREVIVTAETIQFGLPKEVR